MTLRAFLEDPTATDWEKRAAEAIDVRIGLARSGLQWPSREAVVGLATHAFASRGLPMAPDAVAEVMSPFLDSIRFDVLDAFLRSHPERAPAGAEFVDALCASSLVVALSEADSAQKQFDGVKANHVRKVWEWLRENCTFPLVGVCD
ncbi:MAG: hypothetical protein ACQGVC_09160 [Myxococcota bacterium]